MMKTILALGTMLPAEMTRLEQSFNLIRLWKESEPDKAIRDHARDTVAILSSYNGLPVTKRILEALPNVSMIAQFGAGVDNIDLAAAKERGIVISNTPDILTEDTADIAMALILAVSRRIVEADLYVRTGKWHSGAFPLATSLTGKVAGIVGMGRIGRAIATRCRAFGMDVIYHGPRAKPDVTDAFYADLHDMAEKSDYLILACPGGDGANNLINARVLKSLGPKGFIINIARGSVIDTEALLIALSNRAIAGAALDVYQNEPNVDPALISMDNVVLLPHIGSATAETRAKMGRLVIDNITAHFDGKNLLTPVGAA